MQTVLLLRVARAVHSRFRQAVYFQLKLAERAGQQLVPPEVMAQMVFRQYLN
jgi:hypothetical protein